MRPEDLAQVTQIDREAFPTLWPPANYHRELNNRLAHYIVACDSERTVGPSLPQPAPENRFLRLLSRVGSLLTWSIERMAGGKHYRNSKQFLKEGGLHTFIRANRLSPIEKHDIALGNSSIVVAQFEGLYPK